MSQKQKGMEEVSEGADAMAALDDAAAMEEFKKAFTKIEAQKSGEEEAQEDDPPSEEGGEEEGQEDESLPQEDEKEASESPGESPEPHAPDPETLPRKKERKPSLWELKREKYELLEEKERIEAENRRLKEELEASVYRGTYHYGKSAYASLDKAIADKKRAIEDGDTDALIQADRDLIKAERAVDDLERWMEQEKEKESPSKPEPTPALPPAPAQPSPKQMAMVQDWLGEHPTINPASPSYDVSAGQEVGAFVNYLDSYIHQNNLHGTLYSPAYFEAIENFMADREKKSMPAKEVTPRPQNVAGVKNAYGGSAMGKTSPLRITLTADEKRMARTAGLSEKDWLKYKIDEMKEKK